MRFYIFYSGTKKFIPEYNPSKKHKSKIVTLDNLSMIFPSQVTMVHVNCNPGVIPHPEIFLFYDIFLN